MSKRADHHHAKQDDLRHRTNDRPVASFLVRCWLEPREAEDKEPVLRGYLRNLKSGEETYIGDLKVVEQQILASLLDEEAERGTPIATVPTVGQVERG